VLIHLLVAMSYLEANPFRKNFERRYSIIGSVVDLGRLASAVTSSMPRCWCSPTFVEKASKLITVQYRNYRRSDEWCRRSGL
jgi:hypothetical protein